MTNFDDYSKKIKESWSLWERLSYWFELVPLHHFRRITGICPHDETVGRVGGKWHRCLDCGRKVFNSEWKEEREAVSTTKTK